MENPGCRTGLAMLAEIPQLCWRAHPVRVAPSQGITISEIARRTGHDRMIILSYLRGDREPGMRHRTAPDAFDAFTDFVIAGSVSGRWGSSCPRQR